MNRSRLTRLEEIINPIPPNHSIDENGWHCNGGGKGAAGILHTPPVLSAEQWLAEGNSTEDEQGRS